MKPNRVLAKPELCALCKDQPWEHRLDHGDWNYGFCSACYQEYYWTCPDCSRSFWTGFNKGYKPRHFREVDELDHRWRRKRYVCEGWKKPGRKAVDRKYGWNLKEQPKRAGPVIHDPDDHKKYPKYK